MKNLEKEISVKRNEMIALAEKLGLRSPEVLAISQELDILINKFLRSERNMENVIFEIVYVGKTEYLSYQEMKQKYIITGHKFSASQREELQGSPIVKGFLGAMWGGYKNNLPVLRYETQEVYNLLSI